MWFTNVGIYLFFACFLALALAAHDDSQFVYLKSVRCKHNPRLLGNVSCFAKSYSRTISKATIRAVVKIPQTMVMASTNFDVFVSRMCVFNCNKIFQSKLYFDMFYKYGTIYREVMHSPRIIDWCFYMNNLDFARKGPLFKQFADLLESISPGFVRPCPWKVSNCNFLTFI